MTSPPVPARRGDLFDSDAGIRVLVISSTVYNEIPGEPTVLIVPVFDTEPDAGFGVAIGDGWAAPGLITSMRKVRLVTRVRHVDVQTLTDVNAMLFRILATPER